MLEAIDVPVDGGALRALRFGTGTHVVVAAHGITASGMSFRTVARHLPPELRQEMDNVAKEVMLPSKEELIKLYYLSVSKKSLTREE